MADFPGSTDGRMCSAVFVINGKAYIFGGALSITSNPTYYNDLWEFDPIQNTWTGKTSLPSDVNDNRRAGAIAFALQGKGYLGGGYRHWFGPDALFSDLWEYDPSTDQWTLKNVLPSTNWGNSGLFGCATATSCDKAYIFIGYSRTVGSTKKQNRFWSYDPVANAFTRQTDYPSNDWAEAKDGFFINGKLIGGYPNYRFYGVWQLAVNGPAVTCSGASFTASNVPSGGSLMWTRSSNLSYISGQGTSNYSVSVTSPGQAWVKVRFDQSCGTTMEIQKDLWNGKPHIEGQLTTGQHLSYGPTNNPVCNLVTYTTDMDILGATNPVLWTKVSSTPPNISWGQNGSNLGSSFWAVGQTATFRITSSNACGNTIYDFPFISISCSGDPCSQFQVSPNPAKGGIEIVIPNIPAPCGLAEPLPETWVIEEQVPPESSIVAIGIYSQDGQQIQSKDFTFDQQPFKVDLAGLRRGLYIVRIQKDGYVENHRIYLED